MSVIDALNLNSSKKYSKFDLVSIDYDKIKAIEVKYLPPS